MNALRTLRAGLAALACLLWLGAAAGCASQQDTAARVVAESKATLDVLREEASRLAPEQYAAAESALRSMQQKLEQRDYASVLGAFPGLTVQLTELKAATVAKRAELEAALERARSQWSAFSTELPGRLDALQQRVDELGRAAKLPEGIDRALLERARKTLEELRGAWSQALEAAAQGRVPDAAEQAREARERAAQLEAELGVKRT